MCHCNDVGLPIGTAGHHLRSISAPPWHWSISCWSCAHSPLLKNDHGIYHVFTLVAGLFESGTSAFMAGGGIKCSVLKETSWIFVRPSEISELEWCIDSKLLMLQIIKHVHTFAWGARVCTSFTFSLDWHAVGMLWHAGKRPTAWSSSMELILICQFVLCLFMSFRWAALRHYAAFISRGEHRKAQDPQGDSDKRPMRPKSTVLRCILRRRTAQPASLVDVDRHGSHEGWTMLNAVEHNWTTCRLKVQFQHPLEAPQAHGSSSTLHSTERSVC